MNLNTNVDQNNTNINFVENNDLSLDEIQKRLFGAASSTDVSSSSDTATQVDPDLTPSESTMKMSYVRNYETEKTTSKTEITKNTKIAIITYVAVVLLLIIGISVCSFLVSNAYASLVSVQAEVASQNETIQALQADVNSVSEQELIDLGLAMGFVHADSTNSYTYTMLDARDAQTFDVGGNWFDSFCDWLSEVFGG